MQNENNIVDNISIQKTDDGSTTIYSSRFSQPYHNRGGAVAESRYVFFESTELTNYLSADKNLHILEIGFGTGLNLVLLLDYLHQTQSSSTILFRSVEAYPLSTEKAQKLDFNNELEYLNYRGLLHNIFSDLKPGWNSFDLTTRVRLQLFAGTFKDMNIENTSEIPPANAKIDFVFHDPFSPDQNPEGWSPGLFKKIADSCSTSAVLSTYSAATSARASMAVSGWYVARASGALGKREMTIASMNPEKLHHLKRVNEQKLIKRFKNGDFD